MKGASLSGLAMDTTPGSAISLHDLLPHRDTMLLLDEVLEVDRQHALTLSRVDRSWPMAEEQGIPALILIELAAQTAGVCNGWDRIQTKGLQSEKMGWLVGIKKADFYIDYLPFDTTIRSHAENTHVFANLREVTCLLHIQETLIGKMTLQLFQA